MEKVDCQRRFKEIFEEEIKELRHLGESISPDVNDIVELLFTTVGKIVVLGVGKSGIVGRKIASSFASTGTPAIFVNADEAVHGDLGMISHDDTAILISNSGSTDEVINVIAPLRKIGCKLIAMTGNPQSRLADLCDYTLSFHIDKEVCPLGLAPTTSTTATLMMGDALMVCLMEMRSFSSDNFAIYHPGGALGKKLKAVVKDSMVTSIPTVNTSASLMEIVTEMSNKKLGMTLVCDQHDNYVGIITDGDLRRAIQKYNNLQLTATKIMTSHFKSIHQHAFLSDALAIMDKFDITSLVITEKENSEKVVGILSIHNILDFN